ncbi:nicotinic acid-CoA ligase pyr1-like [Ostrinia furnacalis]|uniref:nicotinic acid-CoA ligase pyr1-like n=1 Tax=Ostrinia furnacalis TaxID=93504 RepID=UPI00103BFA2B|nr:nicotinic acid-CoA ligase pyr1-like [Ostrinia furnacalis]
MSHAVVRGAPTAAQRYADGALDAWLRARGREPSREARARVSAAQLLLHCMRQAPDFVCMINGATGEQTTNREMLELAIPFARKLRAQGLKGKTVMLVARDHERTVAVFLGLLLAGVLAYLTDPGATKYELQHYLRLVEPALVFCDEATQAAVRVATADAPAPAHVLPIHDDALLDYIQGHTDDLDFFEAEDSEEGAASLLLPTSGSTGLPKAAQYNQRALVAQLPTVWMHYEKFPTPTERVMLLTTPQWSTFTITVATCCLYNVTLVMSPKEATVENVLDMMQRCRPTWTFFGPPFAKQLAKAATPDHFSSLETVMTLGSQVSPDIMTALKEKMAPGSNLCDGFGMTEAHGFLAVAPRGAAPSCQGRCANIFHYRLVKNDDEDAATDEEGELYIKGSTIIKEKMAPGSNMCDGYGMTEVHGFVTVAERDAAPGCNGPCANIFHYRLVKSDDEDAATDEEGELTVKGLSLVKTTQEQMKKLFSVPRNGGMLLSVALPISQATSSREEEGSRLTSTHEANYT